MIKKIAIIILITWIMLITMVIYNLRGNLNKITSVFTEEISNINYRYNEVIDNELELLRKIYEQQNNAEFTDNQLLEKLENLSFILKEIEKSEVSISTLLNSNVFVRGIFGGGAGTIIKKTENEMYILTCYHVVEEIIDLQSKGINIPITIGYSEIDRKNIIAGLIIYTAEIIKTNKEKDLALLKTSLVDNKLIAVDIAKEEPQKGDIVYSVGSPLGLLRTISKGILSNKQNGFYFSDNTITFGNSGGGLYNEKGELIGVPAQVFAYGNEEVSIPESSLGKSIDLQTIKGFLEGVDY